MGEVHASDPTEVLAYFHERLHVHFNALNGQRTELKSPVFALEHDLGEIDLQLLFESVRAFVAWGLQIRHMRLWLPFVVYAAEHGYDYIGDKYWPPFEAATPGWEYQHRDWLRAQFISFARSYGGARPEGAFAGNFPIIAWPITHAVLPAYLQRYLAKLLYEFRAGLSTALLGDPGELGRRLAARTGGYTERFRIFCANTELLGHVAAALLAGEDEDSPYLIRSTLDRIVEGLKSESQARRWLASARQSASSVRSSGFKLSGTRTGSRSAKLPRATDPRLCLRFLDGRWNAYAELPNLTVLSERLSHVYDELSHRRAEVNGVRKKLAIGRLTYGGQEVRFASWPDPRKPFVQLERGTTTVNQLLADQCVLTHGSWWLFRQQGAGLATEIKGRVLRPGHRYVLVGDESAPASTVPWSQPASLSVSGVSAYTLDVPDRLTDRDVFYLEALGLAVQPTVAIRPVGLVASAWDGEGSAEWLAGEPAIIGIHSDLVPSKCVLSALGELFPVEWPVGETELFLSLDGLEVGTHEISVVLLGVSSQELTAGALLVTIRDPQVRPEIATPGEGIRVLASPARPTLEEFWEYATVVIDGPVGGEADLCIRLRSGLTELVEIYRTIVLPVDEQAWEQLAKGIRADKKLKNAVPEAESCVVTVSSSGVGFASLVCECSFVPLRWHFKRQKDGSFVATLVDRTRSTDTQVEFFSVESPMTAVSSPSDHMITLPPRGGLLCATSDEAVAVEIAPTNPNALLTHPSTPNVVHGTRSPAEIERLAGGYRRWASAPVPKDAFAARQRELAMDAFPRVIALMVCGSYWARIERLAAANDLADYVEQMRRGMGVSDDHKALGGAISHNLWNWLSHDNLALGFAEVIAPALKQNGVWNQPLASRFLITLAERPGYILSDWSDEDRAYLLERVVGSPVLLRAARFAILGAQLLNSEESELRGSR